MNAYADGIEGFSHAWKKRPFAPWFTIMFSESEVGKVNFFIRCFTYLTSLPTTLQSKVGKVGKIYRSSYLTYLTF
jgi:hypothetical protein